MRSRFLTRNLGKAIAAGALVAGIAAVVVPQTASAQSSVALYVKPAVDGGNDTGNNCTLASQPCATIAHAITEEASLAPNSVGSVINLSKGEFNAPTDTMFAALATANSGVTITGAGKKTVVEPSTCTALTTVGAITSLITFETGEDGITVENLDLNGAFAATNCAAYYTPGAGAGVHITDGTTGDAVVGDIIQSGATYGILTDDNADSTIISNNLTPVLCTSTVKGPNTGLNAGWTTPADLKVKSIPKCAQFIESGHGAFTGVVIDGIDYCATPSATGKTIVLTGVGQGCVPITNSGGVEVPTGATITFNTSVAPFLNWGISCNSVVGATDATTDCAISDNSVTAGGAALSDFPVACGSAAYTPDGFPPIGIVSTGEATADIDGNTVSNVADSISSCPEAGETAHTGIGIAFYPNASGDSAGTGNIGVNDLGTPSGAGNKLSGNDTGIEVIGAATAVAQPAASYQVNSNTVSSGNNEGIVLASLGAPASTASLDTPAQSNSVTGILEGEGYVLDGVIGQTFGGALSSTGNSATGDGVGLVLAGPSDGNTIQNNSLTGNELDGVLVVGVYQPEEIDAPVSHPCVAGVCPTFAAPLAQDAAASSEGNTFNGNTWTGNSAGSPLVDVANVFDGTGWGGGCASEVGDCGVTSLTFDGANTTFSSSNPGTSTITLDVCNTNATSAVLPVGTEITFYSDNAGDSGTFYVTKDAVVTGDNCTTGPDAAYGLSIQALNPQEVGTDSSPTGQPYILGTGSKVEVNLNGAAAAGLNIYGTGAKSNSCTPTTGVFGSTNPPATNGGSPTVNASSGGVNATYDVC